jgi:hypothetical protein
VSTIEPISLALFLGVPKSGTDRNIDKENSSTTLDHMSQHTATPNSSAIVTMIEMLLNKVLYLIVTNINSHSNINLKTEEYIKSSAVYLIKGKLLFIFQLLVVIITLIIISLPAYRVLMEEC